jgi:hypothetical protein
MRKSSDIKKIRSFTKHLQAIARLLTAAALFGVGGCGSEGYSSASYSPSYSSFGSSPAYSSSSEFGASSYDGSGGSTDSPKYSEQAIQQLNSDAPSVHSPSDVLDLGAGPNFIPPGITATPPSDGGGD